jgi:hypothetical protein
MPTILRSRLTLSGEKVEEALAQSFRRDQGG